MLPMAGWTLTAAALLAACSSSGKQEIAADATGKDQLIPDSLAQDAEVRAHELGADGMLPDDATDADGNLGPGDASDGSPDDAGDLGSADASDSGPLDARTELGDGQVFPPVDAIEDLQQETVPEIVSPCDVKPVLTPFEFSLQVLPPGEAEQDFETEALVSSITPWMGDYAWQWEMHFALATEGEVVLLASLPQDHRPPVEVGETVRLRVLIQQPWWLDRYFAIWDESADLRFLLYDGDAAAWAMPQECAGGPCPVVELLDSECPSEPGWCGDIVHPPISFSGAGWPEEQVVAQGVVSDVTIGAHAYHFFGVSSERVVGMQCDDYPDQWAQAVFSDDFEVPQCTCPDAYGGCAECVSDCDCGIWGNCDKSEGKCGTCKTDKIAFNKENPEAYEFYEICIPGGFPALEAALKVVDPTLYCGVTGAFSKCAASEVGCHGDLEFVPGTKTLSDSKWKTICSLSLLDYVIEIGGGHFID